MLAATALTATAAHARELSVLVRTEAMLHESAREESTHCPSTRLAFARHAITRVVSALLCVLLPRFPPGVSVITPTWQRHELLFQRCLPSVRMQSYRGDTEHIVVSDGPDPELAAVLPGLVTLPDHQVTRNRGLRPRRHGTTLARHELIAYLDDDNAWRPGHLEMLARALTVSGADFAFSRALCHDQERGVRYTIGTPVPELAQIDTSLIMHRRELLGVASWQPSGGPADWDLVSRWLRAGATWVFVPDITLDYYVRPAASVMPVRH